MIRFYTNAFDLYFMISYLIPHCIKIVYRGSPLRTDLREIRNKCEVKSVRSKMWVLRVLDIFNCWKSIDLELELHISIEFCNIDRFESNF